MLSAPLLFGQNVGIGITTPLQKLHVDGTARLNSLAGAENQELKNALKEIRTLLTELRKEKAFSHPQTQSLH